MKGIPVKNGSVLVERKASLCSSNRTTSQMPVIFCQCCWMEHKNNTCALQMKAEYVAERLPDSVTQVGTKADVKNFWLFPIIVVRKQGIESQRFG